MSEDDSTWTEVIVIWVLVCIVVAVCAFIGYMQVTTVAEVLGIPWWKAMFLIRG